MCVCVCVLCVCVCVCATRLKEDQLSFALNLEVQLLLKQGQVEVDSGQFVHDYHNSVLVHRSVVEDLNTTIKVPAPHKTLLGTG